jgi:hypothetical protein
MKYADITVLIVLIILALALCFLYPSSGSAQEEMKHPETGEVGVWVPTEVQRGHLLTEAELNTCIGERAATQAALEKKKEETVDLRAGLKAGDQALKALDLTLVATNLELDKVKKQKQRRTRWLWGTSGGTVVAVVVLAVVLIL